MLFQEEMYTSPKREPPMLGKMLERVKESVEKLGTMSIVISSTKGEKGVKTAGCARSLLPMYVRFWSTTTI